MHPLDQVKEGISEIKFRVFVEHFQSCEDAFVCLLLISPYEFFYLIVQLFLVIPEEVLIDKGGFKLCVDVCVEGLYWVKFLYEFL